MSRITGNEKPISKRLDAEKSRLVARYKRIEQRGFAITAGVYTAGLHILHQVAHLSTWPALVYTLAFLGALFGVGALAYILFGRLEESPSWVPGVVGGTGGGGIVLFACAAAAAWSQSKSEFAGIAFVAVVALTILPVPSLTACARRQSLEQED